MSRLVHLCRTCDHPVGQHSSRDAGYTLCRCCRGGEPNPDPEPTLRKTFACRGGAREDLYAPGSIWNAGTMHAVTLCDCARCRELFAAYLPADPAC